MAGADTNLGEPHRAPICYSLRPTRSRVVAEAHRWLGTPYRHQGAARGAGCDCLGLVRGIWRALYGAEPEPVPPYGADPRDRDEAGAILAAAERWFVARSGAPEAGDLILFRLDRRLPPRHCGVMVEGGRFIHAQEGVGVIAADLTTPWRRRVAGSFAFPER